MQYFFYFIFFISFYSPVNSASFFGFSSVLISSSEIAFVLLPLINLSIKKNKLTDVNIKYVKEIGIAFICYVVAIEFIKEIMIEGSIGDFFKSLRLSLPLLSAITILITGLRVDIKKFWFILLITIFVSNLLSIFAFLFEITRFLPPEESYTRFGRMFNSNSGFGLIALYLIFESKKVWYNKGWFVFVVVITSFVGLLLSGNRTMIIVAILLSLFIGINKYSVKTVLRSSFFLLLAVYAFYLLYSNNQYIERQMNRRVLPLISGDVSVLEDAYFGSREIILEDTKKKLENGSWMVGLPYSKEIFEYGNDIYQKSGRGKMKMTDTSLINILLRYGVLALLLFLLFFFFLYRGNYLKENKSYIFLYTFPFYFLAAFNIDELVQHNSILFIIISLYLVKSESFKRVEKIDNTIIIETSPNSQDQTSV